MDKGIYTALSGGLAKSRELELVSNNLANANTPGFKEDTGTFSEYLTELRHPDSVEGLKRQITADTMLDGRPPGDKSFVEMDGVYTNFHQGSLSQTNRKLDVALQGEGFFEVLTPTGVRYTRQGNFSVNKEGTLVTTNGFPVLGTMRSGPPTAKEYLEIGTSGKTLLSTTKQQEEAAPKPLTPEQRVIKLGQGQVQIALDGKIYQNGANIGTISVQEFKEPQYLEKVGNSYYRNTNPENPKTEKPATETHQGFVEGSNVNPIRMMAKLIEVTRAYESHMQAIKTYQDIDNRTVNEIAKER